jgi:hypothetical protein
MSDEITIRAEVLKDEAQAEIPVLIDGQPAEPIRMPLRDLFQRMTDGRREGQTQAEL